ncbi:hypothetical protein [Microseira sp. BLCC-F43]|jgi:hypothetical protein|uniref:hypothetical protein n=1 Tax=Microseira sp. BLCC-F43 TaxID=3153602 RepID=UPI0035BAEF86
MQVTEEQIQIASDNFSAEVLIFLQKLKRKCKCSKFESLLLGRAIIHRLLDNLSEDSLKEFEEFLARVREGQIPL